jgi:hypothetical protein
MDPNKYKEDVISTRQFRLRIFNISKADVNCYYKCVYGFKFDEKKLDLNTTSLVDLTGARTHDLPHSGRAR